jgi:lipopolysaccharide transport system ATP-binding protein
MNPIIELHNISKKYSIGADKSYLTLRENLSRKFRSLVSFGKRRSSASSQTDFWALKDVSFSVQEGEVIGIIGRNGAGKSTLLKILSKITPPTEGKITMRGRVASLLEVGTGFHPELTGRENIYLNGAILGMTRREIRKKFDEIVAFSEVEKFLDTPVKRYSSGMYVRLAFAVAAHLEPEILVVDEVLAVGDIQFQKKCLNKMSEVARGGRTVLFVSHNLIAIQSLCTRAILLFNGGIDSIGNVQQIVYSYMIPSDFEGAERVWLIDEDAPGDELVRLKAVRVMDHSDNLKVEFRTSEKIIVEIVIDILQLHPEFTIGFDLLSPDGVVVSRAYHNDPPQDNWPVLQLGRNCLRCVIPPDFLNAGRYSIVPRISIHCQRWIVHLESCISIIMRLDHGISPFWTILGENTVRPGVIAPIWNWTNCK